MSYQGRVVDGTGTGLGTGTPVNRKIIFRLFDAATAGNRLWSEEQTVTLSSGDFSVILGQGIGASFNGSPENPRPSLLDAFGGTDRYLEIVVDNGDGTFNGTDTAITPRQRLISTAFAVRAATADSVRAGTDLTLRDPNHGLGWYGTGRLFNGLNLDGPVLYGYSGGILGSVSGTTQNTALRWTNDGKVGIGTTSPGEKLDVVGNIKASGTITGNRLVSNTTVAANGGSGFTFHTVGDDDSGLFSPLDGTLTFRTNGVERMRLDPDGDLGLGVTNPTEKIEVAGNIKASGVVSGTTISSAGNLYATGQAYAGGLLLKGGFPVTDVNFGGDGNYLSFSHSGFSEDFIGYRSNTFYFKDSPGGGDSTEPSINVGGNGTFGGLGSFGTGGSFGGPVVVNTGYRGGLGGEPGLVNFGINDSPTNRFGGSYTQGVQGGVIRVDARDTYDVFQFLAREKNSSSDIGVVASISAAGKMSLGGKRVPVAEEDLRMIRGSVNAAAARTSGTGFTPNWESNGVYKVTFDTAFPGQPTVIASMGAGVAGNREYIAVFETTTTYFKVTMANTAGNAVNDRSFNFIVLGPR